MGHSAGGVFTQLLMHRGYGAAGVAINSAPTEGVKRVPLAQIKATFPVFSAGCHGWDSEGADGGRSSARAGLSPARRRAGHAIGAR